jgi:alpha-glucosidase
MRNFLLILVSVLAVSCSSGKMQSPDKGVEAKVFIKDNRLHYNLKYNGKLVVEDSPMGITIDGVDLGENADIKLLNQSFAKLNYPTRGVHKEASSEFQEYTFEVKHSVQKYMLEAKVFNDGFAYRYTVPGKGTRKVNSEASSWKLPNGTKVWFAERLSSWKLLTYAGEWLSTTVDSLYKVSSQGPIQLMPIVAELPEKQGYAVIAEAALYDYSGIRLEAKQGGILSANFTEKEGFDLQGNIISPWRVTILAKDLNELVNTDIITSLNPTPDEELFADQSWIKPGRSVWSWWSDPKDYMTVGCEQKFIDYASDWGYEYTTIDEGWERVWKNKWGTLKRICDYGKKKNVGVFVWRHWKDLNNPKDNYRQMAMFLDSVAQAGGAGVKVDFMNGESKEIIDFDITLLKYAAQRKLLVNFHGCQKPSGEIRTYPNEITREGVRGIELNRITANFVKKQKEKGVDVSNRKYVPGGENQDIPASHNVTLPFTRCVLGAADYTPVAFSRPGNTTWAHQLATAYLITSPMLVLAEHPEFILSNPKLKSVVPFIKNLPSTWDQTIVLPQSEIGELAAMARRSGDVWYVAVASAGDKKDISVSLDFLSDGEYRLKSISDFIGDAKNVKSEDLNVRKGQMVELKLGANGGYVACMERK